MKTYFVDIDGTICGNTYGKYEDALPYDSNIQKINSLYSQGNKIIYWTARGANSGIDWTELTTNQLKKWGVKYTELRMGKPHYDLFICDKVINSSKYFNMEEDYETK